MLDTLTKFGAYRVNYFEPLIQKNPEAFGFYIRAEIDEGQAYSHEAKHQLYTGLDLIQRVLGINNLVGIYMDVNCLVNLQRPAYQQMKRDVIAGYFHRILILDAAAITGCPDSEKDLSDLAFLVGGLQILAWNRTKLIVTSICEPMVINRN
jgi:hypothetical protein